MQQLHHPSQGSPAHEHARSTILAAGAAGCPTPSVGETQAAVPIPPRDDAMEVAEAALALDAGAVAAALRRAFRLRSWEGCQRLMTRAARILGDRWADDRCTFMDVTVSVALLHRTYRSTLPDPDVVPTVGRLLLTAAPGAQHTFGLSLTADRLRRSGWEVEMGWPFAPSARALRRGQDVVGVSVSGPRDYAWATEWSRKLRDRTPGGTVVFGGWGAAGLAEETGLQSWGPGHDALGA